MNNLEQIKSLLTDVIKLSDGKIVININFFNAQAEAKTEKLVSDTDPEYVSIPRASQLYGFSENFFYTLARNNPELKDKSSAFQNLFSRNKLDDYFKSHPEHRLNKQSRVRSTEDIDTLLQRSVDILKTGKKELYPERGIARSLKCNYYTHREIAEKLGVSYTKFTMKIRPLLPEKLKNDAEYQAWLKSKGEEKHTYDELIEKAIEILDKEGKAYKTYNGRNSNSDEYMSAKELAERLEIPYHIFNDKIRPALQGEIYEKKNRTVEGKIEAWKEKNLSRV